MSRAIVARANALAAVAIVALMALLSFLIWQGFDRTKAARDWALHSQLVLTATKDLNLAVRSAETGQRGYLLTSDEYYLIPYHQNIGRIGELVSNLQGLTRGDALEQEQLGRLVPMLQEKQAELAQTIQRARAGDMLGALGVVRSDVGEKLTGDIESVLNTMEVEEERVHAKRLTTLDAEEWQTRWLSVAGASIALLLLGIAGRWLAAARQDAAMAEATQRALAARLRISLDSLSQGVGVFGSDQRLTNWNECFQVLLGVPPAMVRQGRPYAAFVEQTGSADGTLLESEEQLRHSRAGRSANEPVVYERVGGADGQALEIRRTPMPGGGFVITITDMTQRVRSEEMLRDAQKMQAVGQLTGGIAHDFNNLLTVIIGNMESLAKRLTDETLRQRIERALWAAQRGATLTRHLLAFARKQPLDPRPINFSTVLPDMVGLLKRTLGEHIDVRLVESAGLWNAMADVAQLESAMLNLALNARDAMPDGGRLTIEVANRVLDADYARQHAEVTQGDYAMLAVSDTGCGMTPDVVKRVFEPFFTTKPPGKGTGLGLAMVYGFVKQSNGHVKIYSEPGEGTSVKIYLPRAVGPATIQRAILPLDLPRGHATLLVVEDDPEVREIAASILRELGYHVLEASDGEQALQLFDAHLLEVDMLLVDVVLPGKLRGRELAERITAMRPSVRVLYMSGYTENAIVHHGRLDEGVHLLGKPFKRDQLARKVADVLGTGEEGRGTDNVIDLAKERRRD
ncbi:MAG TPA: CHASE3 domain-containing protein [Acetobacteraceae bacterium]|jgi:signal transduction histidine kinase/ActR/RegA family two-component response regulator